MFRFKNIFLVAVLFVSGFVAASNNVAVIDVRKVLLDTPLVRAYGQQIAKKAEPRFRKLQKRIQTVSVDMHNFAKESSMMSLNARERTQKKIAVERAKISADRQKALQFMRSLQTNLARCVDDAFNQVCEQLAKQKKLALILRKNSVIVNNGMPDLTNEAISALSKAMVVLKLPEGLSRISPEEAKKSADAAAVAAAANRQSR